MDTLAGSIFYKIIQGDMPSHKVYEDEDFLVILDIFPTNLGHCLVLPKVPAKDIFGLDEKTAEKLYPLAKKLALAVKKATACDGINILQNNGKAAGQVVFYFHLHVMPRFYNEGAKNQFTDEKFAEMAAKIAENLT